MSDLLRMTGMYSGMDTETIIQQLVMAKSQKVTNLKNDQKKLEWKQTLWQDLNTRLYKLYTGTLSNMRLTGSYAKKKTSISDPTKATITASEGAVNGTQSLEIKQLAKAGYLTGAVVSMKRQGDVPIYSEDKLNESLDGVTPADPDAYAKNFGSEKTLGELGVGDTTGTLTVTANGNTFTVTASKDDSIKDFIQNFNNAAAAAGSNIQMEYDRGKITVSGTDADAGFKMSSSAPSGSNKTILQGLGLSDTSGSGQTGTFTGDAITMKGNVYEPGDFKNYSEKDKDYKAKVSDISPDLVGKKIRLTVGTGADAKVTTVEITADMEIGQLTSKLSEGGVKASFDEQNQRFFISSTGTGTAKEFQLEGLDEYNDTDDSVLIDLGLAAGYKYDNGSESTRIDAQDSEIILNGAKFTSDTNTITVNGLSITASAVTDEPVTITTDTDYDGIYDMIKDFIAEYNDIMNEMTKLYSADSARKFNMLSDDEKAAMSDDEIEKWEDTIKDSLLRRDKDLNTVIECMRGAVNKGYDIGGQTLYLVNFGVGTGSYFDTEKGERNALHIFGDSDDEKFSDEDNALKAAIAKDPDQVIELFAAMSKEMYNSLQKTMASTDYRSIYKIYDDKRLKSEYDDYTKKIKEAEEKLNAYEDKWYKKFSAMEVALSKLQSSQNSLASMLGQ
ncbi:MAG: flagellar filament capping protein FliD [Lachnospiraceae bacterium]|nr:flagellar filament capping protein FliD [Lachnospiraceae bacterium]